MPYAGRRSGDSFAAFAAGAQLGMAQKRQKAMEAQQKIENEIAMAQEARAKEMHAQILQSNEQRMMMARGEFEANRLDDARTRKMADEQQAARAESLGASATSNAQEATDYGKLDHRLIPDVENFRLTMNKLATPEAKATFAAEELQRIAKKKQELELDDADAAWNDLRNQGGMNRADGTPDESLLQIYDVVRAGMQEHRASGGKAGISGAQGMQLLTKAVAEAAKNEGIAQARAENAQSLEPLISNLRGDSREAGRAAINAYRRGGPGGPTWDQTQEFVMGLVNPKPAMTPYQEKSLQLREQGMQARESAAKDEPQVERAKARQKFISDLLLGPRGRGMKQKDLDAEIQRWERAQGQPQAPAANMEQRAWFEANRSNLQGKSPQEIEAAWQKFRLGG